LNNITEPNDKAKQALKYYGVTQRPKMKELWDNKEDDAWEERMQKARKQYKSKSRII